MNQGQVGTQCEEESEREGFRYSHLEILALFYSVDTCFIPGSHLGVAAELLLFK